MIPGLIIIIISYLANSIFGGWSESRILQNCISNAILYFCEDVRLQLIKAKQFVKWRIHACTTDKNDCQATAE